MAENEAQATDTEPANKKPMLLFVGGVLLALGLGVGGTLYFVQGSQTEVAAEEEVVETNAKAIYHSLRPAFVVNYMADNKSRYLQAEITLMARDGEVMDAVVEHGPYVRSQILKYLSDQQFNELRTDAGKQKTRDGLKDLLNESLKQQAQVSGIESVLLTNFVMQ